MRFAVASALAAVLALGATAAAGNSSQGTPRSFEPSSAAAVGTSDLWVLGGRVLLRSRDAGKHFTRIASPPFPSRGTVPTLEFANARDGFSYVLDSGPLYVTRDGGSSWHRAGPAGHVVAFALGGGYAYLVAGRVFERSPVGRNGWRRLTARPSKHHVSLAARGPDVWLLGGPRRRSDGDTISLSSDRGRTFASRKGPCLFELGGALVPGAGGIVWAVCPTGMMAELSLSRDGGRSFPAIRSVHDPGGLRLPSLTNGAEIAAASPRVAVLSGGGGGALLRTVDAGRHWRSVPGTARIEEVFWLRLTTSRVGAALVQTGSLTTQLWRTTDAGATWQTVAIR